MKTWLKRAIKKLYSRKEDMKPLITIYISKKAIINNLNYFRKLAPKCEVAPVLKSNAYGHGLYMIANILKEERLPFLIIDSYFEARTLRNEGIENPLLIIGYATTEMIIKNHLSNIIFTISNLESLKNISKKTIIHLKIDTGMHRQGISIEEIDSAISIIKNNRNIELQGICSHLADADNTNNQSFTKKQISIWNNTVKIFRNHFPNLKYWHISNTSGHNYAKDIDANLTRLGIGLYLTPTPALMMETIISGIRKIKKGEYVGYGCTFEAKKDMGIATIPLGYFEGIDRRLSNKGFVKIEKNNKTYFAPIIGRVSMNITTIDISNIPQMKIDDKVIVISNIAQDKNSIENRASNCDTIPYEIVVHIPPHLKRVLVDN